MVISDKPAVIFILPVFLIFSNKLSFTGQFNSFINSSEGEKIITITGVGDIMPGSSYPSRRYLPPGDNPVDFLDEVAGILKASDIAFGNLEGSFLDNGEPYKKCRDTTICYLFRIPEKYSAVLHYCGFDIISLANNHFGDFGAPGAVRTIAILDSLGIRYAGPENTPFKIFEKDSVIYGFCAFAPTAGSLNLNNLEGAEAIVSMLENKCDIVIVSFHGGAEGADYERVPKTTETFYGENRGNVYEFAHRMIDCGADIVFGHGPHVTRAMELYRDRLICYSLGNFFTYGRLNISGPNGIAPVVTVKTDINGKFLSGTIVPVYQSPEGHVRQDPAKRAIKKLQELISLDFPDTELVITDDGKILHK